MEDKLMMAASELPEPETSFGALSDKVVAPKYHRPWKRTPVVLAAVLALLLCAMGWMKAANYGMWVLYQSRTWSELEATGEEYSIRLPEQLDGVPFLEFRVFGHTHRGASRMEALLNPLYRPVSVDYGYKIRERSDDGTSAVAWFETVLSVSFGTTENELWRYYFQFDENDIWTGCEVPESYYTIEYKGLTLQIGDTTSYNALEDRTVCTRWVHWVDEEKQVAFSISESDYSDPDRVVECAKAVIDLNG